MNSFFSRLLPENVCLPYPTGTTLYAFIYVHDIEESSGEMPSLTLIPGEYNKSIITWTFLSVFFFFFFFAPNIEQSFGLCGV